MYKNEVIFSPPRISRLRNLRLDVCRMLDQLEVGMLGLSLPRGGWPFSRVLLAYLKFSCITRQSRYSD